MPRAFTPAPFHSRHARPYFEGWYFKHTCSHEVYRFATYNGGALLSLAADGADIEAVVARGAYRLRIRARSDALGTLKAPMPSGMNRDIAESITARYEVTLTHRSETLFDGRFKNGGLEMLKPQGLMRRKTTKNL